MLNDFPPCSEKKPKSLNCEKVLCNLQNPQTITSLASSPVTFPLAYSTLVTFLPCCSPSGTLTSRHICCMSCLPGPSYWKLLCLFLVLSIPSSLLYLFIFLHSTYHLGHANYIRICYLYIVPAGYYIWTWDYLSYWLLYFQCLTQCLAQSTLKYLWNTCMLSKVCCPTWHFFEIKGIKLLTRYHEGKDVDLFSSDN